jgi:hypothetical protein
MAWTTPRTWVVGEVVTAALMNTHVRDDFLALFPDHATTLSGSPYHNKFALLWDSDTAPTWWWEFRYLDVATAYKWKFMGGVPMRSTPTTISHANTTTYRFTSTLLTVPRAGVYNVELQARNVTGAGANALYTVAVAGAADDTYAVQGIAPFSYTARRTFAASDALSIAYRVQTGSISTAATDVEIRLTPVEVT